MNLIKKNPKKNGFTLIELVTTIAVITILSGAIIYVSPKLISRQRLKNDAWRSASQYVPGKPQGHYG